MLIYVLDILDVGEERIKPPVHVPTPQHVQQDQRMRLDYTLHESEN